MRQLPLINSAWSDGVYRIAYRVASRLFQISGRRQDWLSGERARSVRTALAIVFCVLFGVVPASHAQTGLLNHSSAEFASGDGNVAYLGLGVVLPLLTDGAHGANHALRTADALLTSTILSEGLKLTIHEHRPDGSTRDSFPSGHATAAFAVATMEAHYHRAEAPFWYLGAAIIADSRVTLHRHYPHDVIAGGLLGVGTSLLELKEPRGLVLSPIIRADAKAHPMGCSMSYSRQF